MAKKVKKKATKPAKAKETKKTKAGKATEKEEPVVRQRQTMAEVIPRHPKLMSSSAILTPDQFAVIAFHRLFTGVIDIDLFLRPTIGKRICLIGKPSMGKSLTAHILTGAAHRTCRYCFRPIIDWVNEKTGEIQSKCKCGKNARMIVIHVDVEDSFDPWWASAWGVHLEDRVYEESGYKYRTTKDNDMFLVMPIDADMAFDFVADSIREGAADFVVIDSIAMLTPGEDVEKKDGQIVGVGRGRVGSRARVVGEGLTKVLNAQIRAHCHFGARATIAWTNQYYQGPVKSVWEKVDRPAAGLKARHVADHTMAFIKADKQGEKAVRSKMGVRSLKITFEAEKCKSAGTGGSRGEYKVVLDDLKTQYGILSAGDTDEAERLYAYLTDLGLYRKNGNTHECLGRKFSTVKDMVSFLNRQDIRYIARYFIYRDLLPVSALAYLQEEDYAYSPFGPDIAFELFREKDDPALRVRTQRTPSTDSKETAGEDDDNWEPETEGGEQAE